MVIVERVCACVAEVLKPATTITYKFCYFSLPLSLSLSLSLSTSFSIVRRSHEQRPTDLLLMLNELASRFRQLQTFSKFSQREVPLGTYQQHHHHQQHQQQLLQLRRRRLPTFVAHKRDVIWSVVFYGFSKCAKCLFE